MPTEDNEETPLSGAREPGVSRQKLLALGTTGGRRFYGPCSSGSRRHEYMSVGEADEETHPCRVGRICGSPCVARSWLALAVAVTAAVAVLLGWWTVGDKEIWIQKQDSSGGMFEV